MSCCGNSNNSGDVTTVVVNTCCGNPEPAGGWESGVDFIATLDSNDLTTAAELTLYTQGSGGTVLTPPSASQRLYLFHVQIVTGVAGNFKLFGNTTGVHTVPNAASVVAQGLLAKYGGIVTKLPNRRMSLGYTLHAQHDVAGRVTVLVLGKLVTEA